jgi:hypothetical protein
VDPLPIRWYVVLSIPMAIDGTTQLFGWRESTWELRLITGFLFGLGTAWLFLPIVERGMRDVRESLERPARGGQDQQGTTGEQGDHHEP